MLFMGVTNMMRTNRLLSLAAVLAIGLGTAWAQTSKPSSQPAAQGDPYPLSTCPISGLELAAMDETFTFEYEGRELRFCSEQCVKVFKRQPAKVLAAVDKRIVEQQLPYYPMTTCPISQEPLTAMGEPVNYVYNNRLVRFCCNGCVRGFKRNPAATLAVLDTAVIEQQSKDYPLTTCPVSKQPLDSMGGPVEYVIANRLVKFCCGGCEKALKRQPAGYLAALDKAWAEKRSP